MTKVELVMCVAFGVFIGHWAYAITDLLLSEWIESKNEDTRD